MYVRPAGGGSGGGGGAAGGGGARAVIYSFKNSYGQKQKVGVVYGDDRDRGPQVNQVYEGSGSSGNNVLRPTPIPLPISNVNEVGNSTTCKGGSSFFLWKAFPKL